MMDMEKMVLQSDGIINGLTISLIPKSNKSSRPGHKMIPKYITIHNTGNSRKGANAAMHSTYVDTHSGYISWHFTVDDQQIIQELPIYENAWHAGDGNGAGNRQSIGIEICENIDGDYKKAEENAAKLVSFLLEELKLDLSAVYPHQHWNGKYCPHKILDEGWDKFMALIESMKDAKIKQFKDYSQIPEWAKDDIEEATNIGIIKGDNNGYLNPTKERIELIVVVMRAIRYVLKKSL